MLAISILQVSTISGIERCWVGGGAVHKLLRAHEARPAPRLRLGLLLLLTGTVACEGVLVGGGVGAGLALVRVGRPAGGREHAGLPLRGRVGGYGRVPGVGTGPAACAATESVLTLVEVHLLFNLLSLLLGHSTKFYS